MRALLLGLIGFIPIAAHAQMNCQKWADGSETCYYADGRIMEGRRQIDGSTHWTENRGQGAATSGAAPSDSGSQADTQSSRRDSSDNPSPSNNRYVNPFERQRPGDIGNSRIGTPGGSFDHCRQWGAASPECDARRR